MLRGIFKRGDKGTMGCQNSKETPAKANGNEPGQPPAVDPRLPLNARQLFLLKKSWKGVKRNMEATGVEMFIGLFRKNGDLLKLFENFRDMKATDDLRDNEMLEAHGMLVMGVFDQCIDKMDDVDHVYAVTGRVGASHARFSGFNPSLFWNMEEPFLAALKIILSDRYTDQMDVIYQLTIKFILASLVKACEEGARS